MIFDNAELALYRDPQLLKTITDSVGSAVRAEARYTDHPFTVAACAACAPGAAADVMPKLRAVVRNCPHAVLVMTECLLGRLACTGRDSDRGVMLLLQPCTTDRVPVASVQWVGPVRTESEAQTVCEWIAAGIWDPSTLPMTLRADVNLTKASRLN
ncbi:hypothetical protein NWT09_27195 [Mycolicibacterium sp. jd]|uniref:hypothetical protein n=1 Tax=Mycolicibacterium TaxID=1866885 RepID=UPI001F42E7DD|nr:hypothetical protein [Mycolicibacterium vanbaalenii]WND56124.1 hypothetical protein QQA43_26005 [Mycolicibacterium vanbaalenii]